MADELTYEQFVNSDPYQQAGPKERMNAEQMFFKDHPSEIIKIAKPDTNNVSPLVKFLGGLVGIDKPNANPQGNFEVPQGPQAQIPANITDPGLQPAFSPIDMVTGNMAAGATEKVLTGAFSKLAPLLQTLIKGGAENAAWTLPQTATDIQSGIENKNLNIGNLGMNILGNTVLGAAFRGAGKLIRNIVGEPKIKVPDIVDNTQNINENSVLPKENTVVPQGPFSPRGLNPETKLLTDQRTQTPGGGVLVEPEKPIIPQSPIEQIAEKIKQDKSNADLKSATDLFKGATEEVKNIVSPGSISDPKANIGKQYFRENMAHLARANDLMETGWEGAKKTFSEFKPEQNFDIYDMAEKGKFPELEAKYGKNVSDVMQDIQKQLKTEYTKVKEGDLSSAKEFYLAHLYEKGPTIRNPNAQFSKRIFPGKAPGTTKRYFDTIQEARTAGYVPISDNPIVMNELKLMQMRKYNMAKDTLDYFKDNGLMKWTPDVKNIPKEWQKVDVMEKARSFETKDGQKITQRLYPYADPNIARIMNNYLSPGLSKSKIFQTWRMAGNALNQAQLGLSAFHAGFTTVDAMISNFAIAEKYLASGKVFKGLWKMAQTPVAGITNAIKGAKVRNAWFGKPGKGLTASDAQSELMAHLMEMGGGRAKMDSFYSNKMAKTVSDYFKQGKYITGVLKAPLQLIETLSKPLMEHLVPNQKAGVFADMMKYEMDAHPNMSTDELRASAQKAWDSVDNRMGQMVYDNLFWDKSFKDLLMASVRSVGWNLGTIREIGGSAIDALKAIGTIGKNVFTGSKVKPEFTHRMAYTTALPIVSGIMGAIYQKLRTGQGPQELKDYYFPKTGKINMNGDPERVSLPTYMKDIYHYSQNTPKTLANKLHPLIGTIADMLNNKDFYGVEIRHPDDPLVKQAADTVKYLGKQIVPFGIRNAMNQAGMDLPSKLQSFIGIVPAPNDINQTPMEKLLGQIEQEKMPPGSRTTEQFKTTQMRNNLTKEMMNKEPRFKEDLKKEVQSGKLSQNDIKTILSHQNTSEMQQLKNKTKSFSFDDISRLVKVANPQERKDLYPLIMMKGRGELMSPGQSPERKQEIGAKLKAIKALYDKYKSEEK